MRYVHLLLVVAAFMIAPALALSDSQQGFRVLIDDREAGGAVERTYEEGGKLVFEQEWRYLGPSESGQDAVQVRRRMVETPEGELLTLHHESGPEGRGHVVSAHQEDDEWVLAVSGSFGSFERRYKVEESVPGPIGERGRLNRELQAVGDRTRYQQINPASAGVVTVSAELTDVLEDGTRVVVKSTREGPEDETYHYDGEGRVVRIAARMMGGNTRVIESIDYDQAADLMAAIAVDKQADEPSILETDTEFSDSSGIVIDQLSVQQADRLVLLGRVWGFLKYHHPIITAGEKHWDFELFRMLPGYLETEDAQAYLVGWIDGLGEYDPCDPCAELPDELHVMPDLGWLADESLLGAELSQRLQSIHRNRPTEAGQFYVSISAGAGFADFRRELPYEDIDLDDSGYRLLTLYRWWNIIEYWFPYRYMIDGDWFDVLVGFVPRIVQAESSDDYRLELLAMAAHIGDGHVTVAGTFDVLPPAGTCSWPVAVRFIEGKPVIAAVAGDAEESLEAGDIIRAIDDGPVDELIAAWMPYYSGSNESARLNLMSFLMGKGLCEPVELVVERNGGVKTVVVERREDRPPARYNDQRGETIRMLSDDVAYLTLSSFEAAGVDDYLEVMQDAGVLVIDIRNYPAEFAVFALGQHLVDQPTEFARFTSGRLDAPGAFAWGPTISLNPREPHYSGRVAILIDEASISQSEYTAMAFRFAPDAIVVGSTTAGANGNVARFTLPGGLSSSISGIGAYYADGSPMQRIGIIADIPAAPTIEGFRAGRDEILETALRELLGPEVPDDDIIEMSRNQ